MPHHPLPRLLALSCLVVLAAGCASNPASEPNRVASDAHHDPLEPVNRVVFDVNDFLDRLIAKPLAELYRAVTPEYFRDRMGGVLSNMNEPVVMANSLMQGRAEDAGKSLGRLAVNSTIGIGGAFDVAKEGLGWGAKPADFGQTLHSWGVGQGPYTVLPFLGPSTLRDTAGRGVDMVMSPWSYVAMEGPRSTAQAFSYSSTAMNVLAQRERNIDALDKLREGSIDYYAQMRSVYLQFRNNQLGIASPVPSAANYYDE